MSGEVLGLLALRASFLSLSSLAALQYRRLFAALVLELVLGRVLPVGVVWLWCVSPHMSQPEAPPSQRRRHPHRRCEASTHAFVCRSPTQLTPHHTQYHNHREEQKECHERELCLLAPGAAFGREAARSTTIIIIRPQGPSTHSTCPTANHNYKPPQA